MNSSLSKGLVFHSPLDEWNGTRDIISGISGVGTAIYPVLSKQGSGRRWIELDGIDYVTLPSIASFGTGDFTVVMKIKTGTIGTVYKTIIGGATNMFALIISPTGKLLAEKINAGQGASAVSTGAVIANTDYTIGYKRSGTTGTYYINGVAAGTATDATDYTLAPTTLSYYASNAPQRWDGSMYMLRCFNYALSPTQITNYSKPEYPIEWVDRGATGADLNTSSFTTPGNTYAYTGFSGASATGYSVTGTSQNGGFAEVRPTLLSTKTFKIKYDLTVNSGTAPSIWDGVGTNLGILTAGTNNTKIFTLAGSGMYIAHASDVGANYTIANVSIQQLGCILDLNAEGLARYSDGSYNVGYWTDKTNQLTATISGATVVIPPASNLGASYFNGSTGKVIFSMTTGLPSGTADRTISMWIRPSLITGNHSLMCYGTYGTGTGLSILLTSTGVIKVTDFNTQIMLDSLTTFTINTWYHIAIVVKNSNVYLYVNGALDRLLGGLNSSVVLNSLWIGVYGTGAHYFFNGCIDDVRMWGTAFDLEQIKLLYDSNS